MLNFVPRHKSDVVLADLATSKIVHVRSPPIESLDVNGEVTEASERDPKK